MRIELKTQIVQIQEAAKHKEEKQQDLHSTSE